MSSTMPRIFAGVTLSRDLDAASTASAIQMIADSLEVGRGPVYLKSPSFSFCGLTPDPDCPWSSSNS
ncbi:MAG: hypothetical protein QGI24_10505, partial [Kiritimatiellia bacterium]|nr:hypothetical protein [Kiritimatiellia bacterium]